MCDHDSATRLAPQTQVVSCTQTGSIARRYQKRVVRMYVLLGRDPTCNIIMIKHDARVRKHDNRDRFRGPPGVGGCSAVCQRISRRGFAVVNVSGKLTAGRLQINTACSGRRLLLCDNLYPPPPHVRPTTEHIHVLRAVSNGPRNGRLQQNCRLAASRYDFYCFFFF